MVNSKPIALLTLRLSEKYTSMYTYWYTSVCIPSLTNLELLNIINYEIVRVSCKSQVWIQNINKNYIILFMNNLASISSSKGNRMSL